MASKILGNCKSKDIKKRKKRDGTARHATNIQPDDRYLIHNMSQRGVTGKLKNYWEVKVQNIIIFLNEEGNVDKVQQKDLSKAMLMRCFDWDTIISPKESIKIKQNKNKR